MRQGLVGTVVVRGDDLRADAQMGRGQPGILWLMLGKAGADRMPEAVRPERKTKPAATYHKYPIAHLVRVDRSAS